MTPDAQSPRALFKGRTIPFDPTLCEALGGEAQMTLALQQLAFLGLESDGGWVAMPVRGLARHLGITDSRAERTFDRLRDRGLIETRDGRGSAPACHRVILHALKGLLPHRQFNAVYASASIDETQIMSRTETETQVPEGRNTVGLSRAHTRPDESNTKIRPSETSENSKEQTSDNSRSSSTTAVVDVAAEITKPEGERVHDVIARWKRQRGL